jgi:hypothetical protein|tara:strand:- start:107 stop:508 length:402 start_codon:yes stop_codon:yes gene_type:complete
MEDFEGKKEIINLFSNILGSKVSIKDNISKTEEVLFVHFVKKLDEAHIDENKLFENSGIDISRYTNPMWDVTEDVLKLLYGEESANLIQWYILDRFNPDGEIVPIEDEDGKQYKFNSPEDLWGYINYRYKKDK